MFFNCMGLGFLMQFWPFYLRQHAKRETRLLHYVGSTAALTVAGASMAAGKYKVLPLVLLAGGRVTDIVVLPPDALRLHSATPVSSTKVLMCRLPTFVA